MARQISKGTGVARQGPSVSRRPTAEELIAEIDMEFEFWHRCPECLNAQWWRVAEPNHACTYEGVEKAAGVMAFEGCGHVPGPTWIARMAARQHGWNGDIATLVRLGVKAVEETASEPAKPAASKRRKSANERASADRAKHKTEKQKPSGSTMKKADRRKRANPKGQQEDIGAPGKGDADTNE